MKRRALARVFAVGFCCLLAGCGKKKDTPAAVVPPPGNPSKSTPVGATAEAGAKPAGGSIALFEQHCQKCHAIADGAGGGGGAGWRMKGPSLAHAGKDHTADWLADHIKNPKAHKPMSRMPAFEGKLSAEEVKSLGDYLASLK